MRVVKRLMSHILMELVKKNNTKVGFDTMEVCFVFFFAVFRMKNFLKITTYIILEHCFRFRAFSQILRNHLFKGSYETFATRFYYIGAPLNLLVCCVNFIPRDDTLENFCSQIFK